MRTVLILMFCSGIMISCSKVGGNSKGQALELDTLPLLEKEVDKSIVVNYDSLLSEITFCDTSISYHEQKIEVITIKESLNPVHINYDSLKPVFESVLLKNIIPYWYGTPWTFEGHTSQPKTGTIACGYFVSTTLRHAGLNVNRFRLAQQSPLNEAKTLAFGDSVYVFSGESTYSIIQNMKSNLLDGVYFLGFGTNHVGFLIVQNGELLVLHSNYIDMLGVQIEIAEKSVAFSYYDSFIVVALSNNRALLEAWVNNRDVKVFD